MFLLVAGGAFRGIGDPAATLRNGALVGILNVILDPLLMFPMGLGVAGAAIATAIAQWAGAIAYAVRIWKRRVEFGLAVGPSTAPSQATAPVSKAEANGHDASVNEATAAAAAAAGGTGVGEGGEGAAAVAAAAATAGVNGAEMDGEPLKAAQSPRYAKNMACAALHEPLLSLSVRRPFNMSTPSIMCQRTCCKQLLYVERSTSQAAVAAVCD